MADQINSEQRARITEALSFGKKIEAIKLHREFTGCGLKESKEYVDKMIAELVERNPEKYSNLSSGSGCRSVAVFLFLLGSSAVIILNSLI